MAIKFSPGPCGCCIGPYAAIITGKENSGPYPIIKGAGFQVLFSNLSNGVVFNADFGNPSVIAFLSYGVISNNADLLFDLVNGTGTFAGGGPIFPFAYPIYASAQVSDRMFSDPGLFSIAIPGASGVFINSCDYFGWLYQMSGAKGNWTILSSQEKTSSGIVGDSRAPALNFTINADGSVGP